MKKVLDILDHNNDGVVTKTEFVSAGRNGLPEFGDEQGLGHHYDSEGEYFLVSGRECAQASVSERASKPASFFTSSLSLRPGRKDTE